LKVQFSYFEKVPMHSTSLPDNGVYWFPGFATVQYSAFEMTYIVPGGALNSTHSLTQVTVKALPTANQRTEESEKMTLGHDICKHFSQ